MNKIDTREKKVSKKDRIIRTKEGCKWGTFSYYADDEFVGRSLEIYGEYSDYETAIYQKLLKPGHIAVEVGSNIGTHTVPIASLVGETGHVYAFEPGTDCYAMLCRNLEQNNLRNVTTLKNAALDKPVRVWIKHDPNPNYPKLDYNDNPYAISEPVEYCDAITVDSLNLERLDFIKIDADGTEQAVIEGMAETIKRCRPIIYIENEIPDKWQKLAATIIDHEYRGWWFKPPLYRPDNHFKNPKNVWPGVVSYMQIFIPEECMAIIKGPFEEVSDIRTYEPDDINIFNREIERYKRIADRNPNDLDARIIAAHYLGLMQRFDEADELIRENLRRDPDHMPSLSVEGLHELQMGNYKLGWQRYELRYHQKDIAYFGGTRKPENVPTWDGKPTDQPVLIWSEQGFGDTIMFCRYFKYVLERAPNAILEVQPTLHELLQYSGIAGRAGIYRVGRTLPKDWGQHCSLPSLPATMHDDGSMIPIDGPYLRPDPALVQKWSKFTQGAKIGLCWRGSVRSERPYTRNISPHMLLPLEKEFGPFFSLNDDGQFDDFMSTAACIMSLDLVLTVDTAVAHLAGALGKEVWLMLAFDPDWRWGIKDNSTPWYPSMRIFRQPSVLNWKAVIDDVWQALDERRRGNRLDEVA